MAVKTIRTKPFLLATAGSTVDGRTIEDKMLREMAQSYNPKTYGARVNIEHIRGISPDAPFNAYGDVVELSIGEVEVDFNGKTEKRTALYGVFDVHESAKALNDKGQKLYPSIEIADNFAGKGFAYLMGCALTDSPAAIATDRLEFNRTDPSRLNVASDAAALVEFVEEATGSSAAADGFFNRLAELLKPFGAGKEPALAATPGSPAAPGQAPAAPAFDPAAFSALIQGIGQQFADQLAAQQLAFTKELELVGARVEKLAKQIDATPAPGGQSRPLATGPGQNFAKTDC